MPLTALHRALGLPAGPIDEALLVAAVEARLPESDELDWKERLPPTKDLNQHEYPKDVAALANTGGGVLVYGVTEDEKRATGRRDVGEFNENHERTLRAAAYNAIVPPVFVDVFRVGEEGNRAVVIVVPPSSEAPHLIYRDKYFGAPFRIDADTEWMKERQVEAAYRRRFGARRRASETLRDMYEEAALNWGTRDRAWLVCVARPVLPPQSPGITRNEARFVFDASAGKGVTLAPNSGTHPFSHMDYLNPRPGLRRWVAPRRTLSMETWRGAWAAVHHDGSVSLAAAVGGRPISREVELSPTQVESGGVEAVIADFMALVKEGGSHFGLQEYDVRVGFEWTQIDRSISLIWTEELRGAYPALLELDTWTPVIATVDASLTGLAFNRQVYELAEDVLNQGGIEDFHYLKQPQDTDDE